MIILPYDQTLWHTSGPGPCPQKEQLHDFDAALSKTDVAEDQATSVEMVPFQFLEDPSKYIKIYQFLYISGVYISFCFYFCLETLLAPWTRLVPSMAPGSPKCPNPTWAPTSGCGSSVCHRWGWEAPPSTLGLLGPSWTYGKTHEIGKAILKSLDIGICDIFMAIYWQTNNVGGLEPGWKSKLWYECRSVSIGDIRIPENCIYHCRCLSHHIIEECLFYRLFGVSLLRLIFLISNRCLVRW